MLKQGRQQRHLSNDVLVPTAPHPGLTPTGLMPTEHGQPLTCNGAQRRQPLAQNMLPPRGRWGRVCGQNDNCPLITLPTPQ